MKQLLFCMAAALSFQAAVANGPIGKANLTNKTKQSASKKSTQAKPLDCVGADKKLINGVCETAQQIWTRSEWDSASHWWRCYYVYRWSDNSQSPEYYVINGAGCIL